MQQLKIPQSQFVTPNNMVAGEWLVFLNELIRLGNLIISSDTIEKGNNAEFASIEQSFVSFDIAASNSQEVAQVALITPSDDVVPQTPIYANTDTQSVDNVPLQITHEESSSDNPYAQMSAIEQQLYDQQIWNLTV